MSDQESVVQYHGTVVVDGASPADGVIQVIQSYVNVELASGTHKPDKSWTYTDQVGHFHAYTDDAKLPTLDSRTEMVGCDRTCDHEDDCEGYLHTIHACRICGEEIEPGHVREFGPQFVPGLKSWRVEISGRMAADTPRPQGPASIRLDTGHQELFGVATLRLAYASSSGEYRIEGYGAGPLGERTTKKKRGPKLAHTCGRNCAACTVEDEVAAKRRDDR